MTLEEAQLMIVELKAQIKDNSDKYNSLKAKNEELISSLSERDQNITKLKEANMRYFEMITAQEQTAQTQTQEAQQQEDSQEPVFVDWSELD